MRVISTVLCLFAAIIMMATPVMACCVTGHMDSAHNMAQAATTNAPPCHTVEEAVTGNTDTQTPEKYCASCDDCAVSPPHTADMDSITNTHVEMTFVALLNTPQALPRPEMRLLRITGPPPRQDLLRADNPLTRFDALLI